MKLLLEAECGFSPSTASWSPSHCVGRIRAVTRRRGPGRGRPRIYEGKGKVLYEGPEPGTLIQHFKDDATAFNAKKHQVIEGKGVLNNRISEYLFQHLNDIGVPTHFIRRLNMREQLIREVEIVPLEVVVRNVARVRCRSASASRRAPSCRARSSSSITRTTSSTTRWCRKSTSRRSAGPPRRKSMTSWRWPSASTTSSPVCFLGIGIRLVDFKMECGRLFENDMMRIIVADEISPDSCRLWDIKSNEKLDKDRFRRDLGNVIESYAEVARRLGIMCRP
jgi:phosphoribosylaminoimidazole-succinocarboxamide synthase